MKKREKEDLLEILGTEEIVEIEAIEVTEIVTEVTEEIVIETMTETEDIEEAALVAKEIKKEEDTHLAVVAAADDWI